MKLGRTHAGLKILGSLSMLAGSICALKGCSTAPITPPPPPQAAPPPFVQVPHPRGSDASELQSIMLSKEYPGLESLKGCDQDVRKLLQVVTKEDERRQGMRELIRRDPVRYHWCFYQKSWNAEEAVRTEGFISDKQKAVIDNYAFIVPVARAFLAEYRESRYLRWSVTQYRRFSERVFFRKVEITPEATAELVQISNPFGLWRDPEATSSVLEKYNIIEKSEKPLAAASPAPANPEIPGNSESQPQVAAQTPAPTESAPATPAPTDAGRSPAGELSVPPEVLPATEPAPAPEPVLPPPASPAATP